MTTLMFLDSGMRGKLALGGEALRPILTKVGYNDLDNSTDQSNNGDDEYRMVKKAGSSALIKTHGNGEAEKLSKSLSRKQFSLGNSGGDIVLDFSQLPKSEEITPDHGEV